MDKIREEIQKRMKKQQEGIYKGISKEKVINKSVTNHSKAERDEEKAMQKRRNEGIPMKDRRK